MKNNVIFMTKKDLPSTDEKREVPEYIDVAGHNPCPCCGRGVRGVVSTAGKYYVECKACGYRREKSFPFCSQEPYFAIDQIKYDWNRGFLESTFSAKTLDAMGLDNGDYLVVDRSDDLVLFAASNKDEIWDFFANSPEDTYCDIYVINDGTLVVIKELI